MKIVILDGQCVNPGDLTWKGFEALGELDVYDISPQETVLQRAQGATALITNKTIISEDLMSRLPDLRYIGLFSTGTNVVDLSAAKQRNVTVCNVPAYSTSSVAQCVFAHLLNLSFHLVEHDKAVRNGDWVRSEHFCFWNTSLVELQDKTFGIVGLGMIGRAVAQIATAFGMKVLAYGPRLPEGKTDLPGVRAVSLDRLLQESDVVSMHCPLNEHNARMVDETFLSKMKPSAFFINTSRGGLVHEADLARFLNENRIAGAGLDVLAVEPPHSDNPLLTAKHCYITPHIAWATYAARDRLMHIAVENLRLFLEGAPQNVVS